MLIDTALPALPNLPRSIMWDGILARHGLVSNMSFRNATVGRPEGMLGPEEIFPVPADILKEKNSRLRNVMRVMRLLRAADFPELFREYLTYFVRGVGGRRELGRREGDR